MKKIRFHRALTVLIAIVGIAYGLNGVDSADSANEGTPMELKTPVGLQPVPIPPNNPMTVEKVELGKMLYFDKRLSKDKTISCATCHDPNYAYTEALSTSKGIKSQIGDRNSPSVINTAYFTSMFWDGREPDLEHQAGGPVENPIEMGHDLGLVAKELNAIPEYNKRFQQVFGEPPSKDTITKAIAAFERTILSGNSPYDQFMNGDASALSAEAKAGMEIFRGKGLCASCHIPPLFSGGGFYNAGVGMDKAEPDIGRMKVSNLASDKGAFRVPALREVAKTAPYFHDGSIEKLEDAVKFMAEGGQENPYLHPLFRALKAQKFTEQEIQQLVAFLHALSGEYPIVQEPQLP
ncbi:MAG: cytochrome-c peroxidase [Candidatus Omnitrophota bacterium]|jgi:cytochrome c peroxidase|nr:MAG: cytochrome-c peroxidase [Candidatus Omnitrophota bacterium]